MAVASLQDEASLLIQHLSAVKLVEYNNTIW
jgi:hypothetical protein